jgi:hypothetical protein
MKTTNQQCAFLQLDCLFDICILLCWFLFWILLFFICLCTHICVYIVQEIVMSGKKLDWDDVQFVRIYLGSCLDMLFLFCTLTTLCVFVCYIYIWICNLINAHMYMHNCTSNLIQIQIPKKLQNKTIFQFLKKKKKKKKKKK